MSARFRFARRIGSDRRSSEDRVEILLRGDDLVIVVADGAGGLRGGARRWIISDTGVDALTTGQHRKRVGSGQIAPVAFHRTMLDGMLVVATDGLFNYVTTDAIIACCAGTSADEATRRLIALPRFASGRYPDDVAVAAVTNK